MAINADLYIFAYQKKDIFIIIKVYINDFILTSQNKNDLN